MVYLHVLIAAIIEQWAHMYISHFDLHDCKIFVWRRYLTRFFELTSWLISFLRLPKINDIDKSKFRQFKNHCKWEIVNCLPDFRMGYSIIILFLSFFRFTLNDSKCDSFSIGGCKNEEFLIQKFPVNQLIYFLCFSFYNRIISFINKRVITEYTGCPKKCSLARWVKLGFFWIHHLSPWILWGGSD